MLMFREVWNINILKIMNCILFILILLGVEKVIEVCVINKKMNKL